MNLDQIATKCFILALFIRDDGERLLLGDGYYDFNQKLQHFQGNTIANDVVEIQGDSGQLLAGQVMRSGAQKFEGYIGDATTNRQTIEQKRSDFMAFFRIKHFYQVIYILPDGTAIQRRRGYLTDAPAVPEIFQKFPEYHIALNFEDVNYYEYAEDAEGNEIYAHIAELALAGGATGGLIWDAIGAVSNGISWSGIQTAQGAYIQVTNALDIPAKLASVEMLGNATQTTYSGKNLFTFANSTHAGQLTITSDDNSATMTGTATGGSAQYIIVVVHVDATKTYNLSGIARKDVKDSGSTHALRVVQQYSDDGTTFSGWSDIYLNTNPTAGTNYPFSGSFSGHEYYRFYIYNILGSPTATGEKSTYYQMQLEQSSTKTDYEPYVGGIPAPNPEFPMPISVVAGENMVKVVGKNLFHFTETRTVTASGVTFETTEGTSVLKINGTSTSSSVFSVPLIRDTSPLTLEVGTYTIKIDGLNRTTESLDYVYLGRVGIGAWVFLNPNNNWQSTFTLTAKTSLYMQSVFASSTAYDNKDVTIQLELGSQATDYQAYQGQEFPIDLDSIELAKIGDYQDRIYKDDGKWYIEKQVGKLAINITGYNSTYTNVDYAIFDKPTDALNYGTYSEMPALCDSALSPELSGGYNQTAQIGRLCSKANTTHLWIGVTKGTTQATAKTMLDGKAVYYALAAPTATEITNGTLIAQLDALESASLYVGVNNIGTETLNAMPTLKIEYYTEVNLDGAGYEWEPGGNTAKTIVTVAGVDSAWPIWTVQGGAQNPTLTNITTGQTITWQGFVPEGQTLTINMAEMTADLAGANVFEYITGEWIRLAPGNNTLVYNAENADKSSTLSWNGVLA